MKRIFAVLVVVGLALPMLALPTSCTAQQSQLGPTFLKLFANPECLQQYGVTIP